MMKRLNTALFLTTITFTTFAHAGWWDDFFGAPTPEPAVNPVQEEVLKPLEAASVDLKGAVTEVTKEVVTQSLVDMVSSNAGVTKEQASGGLGAIFKTAQSGLSKEEFSSISQAVPEMDGLLAAAPTKQEDGGLMSGLLAGAGKAGELIGLFDQLGLSPEQISTFTTLIQQYFSSEEKPELSELLMQGVASFI